MAPPAEMVLTLCSAPLEPWEKACTPEPSRGPFPQAAPSPVLPHPLLAQWFPLPSGLLPFLTNSLACMLLRRPPGHLGEALPSPQSAAVLPQVPMTPPHTVVVCVHLPPLDPEAPRGTVSRLPPWRRQTSDKPRCPRVPGRSGSAHERHRLRPQKGWGL